MGTPAYMAPEQHLGEAADARSDQFAFCVVIWEALYGQRPFPGATVGAIADRVLSGTIEPPPSETRVPAWVRRVLERGLARDPDRRFASMDALLTTLVELNANSERRSRSIAGSWASTADVSISDGSVVPPPVIAGRYHLVGSPGGGHSGALLGALDRLRGAPVRLRNIALRDDLSGRRPPTGRAERPCGGSFRSSTRISRASSISQASRTTAGISSSISRIRPSA